MKESLGTIRTPEGTEHEIVYDNAEDRDRAIRLGPAKPREPHIESCDYGNWRVTYPCGASGIR
jgi:hypothetical protein